MQQFYESDDVMELTTSLARCPLHCRALAVLSQDFSPLKPCSLGTDLKPCVCINSAISERSKDKMAINLNAPCAWVETLHTPLPHTSLPLADKSILQSDEPTHLVGTVVLAAIP